MSCDTLIMSTESLAIVVNRLYIAEVSVKVNVFVEVRCLVLGEETWRHSSSCTIYGPTGYVGDVYAHIIMIPKFSVW